MARTECKDVAVRSVLCEISGLWPNKFETDNQFQGQHYVPSSCWFSPKRPATTPLWKQRPSISVALPAWLLWTICWRCFTNVIFYSSAQKEENLHSSLLEGNSVLFLFDSWTHSSEDHIFVSILWRLYVSDYLVSIVYLWMYCENCIFVKWRDQFFTITFINSAYQSKDL